MIVFGYTLQDLPNELPAEVALWVLEKDSQYPKVDFRIQYSQIRAEEKTAADSVRKHYAFTVDCRGDRPYSVQFTYPKSTWIIRIVGDLSSEQRKEISIGTESTVETTNIYGRPCLGVPLSEETKAFDKTLMLPIEPHWFEKGLQITSEELLHIAENSQTVRNAALLKAMSEKSWKEASRLLKQRH